MELSSKETLARMFRERDWRQVGDALVLEERQIKDDWSWIESRWILIRGKRRQESRVSLRLYSAVELKSLLKEVGFRKVKAYGDIAGAPYDHKANRLIVVAHK